MYFMLGNIAFEPVNLTDFSETHSADFAEHAVLKGKPKIASDGRKTDRFILCHSPAPQNRRRGKVVINRYFRQKPSKTPLP